MDENYLPPKWRNKVFRFQAGGYDGCFVHPAALIVDGDGDVHLVASDGGAGGLDETDWYCAKCRGYLDEHGVLNEGDFLYGPRKDPALYEEFRRLRDGWAAERRRRERRIVLQALEGEFGKEPEEIPGWDHEFDLIGEIDAEDAEKVSDVCRRLGSFFYDVYLRALVADAIRDAGYDGTGFVCTACGKFVDDGASDYDRYADHIDPDAYHGIGGLAVAHTSILCDDCRNDVTCPECGDMTRHPSAEGDHAYDHMTFREAFLVQWLGVCEYCADSFFRVEEYRHWDDDVDELESTIDNAKAQIVKYIAHMREAGRPEEDLERLERKNREQCEDAWRELVNELRDRMQQDVESHFTNANDWSKERLAKGEHYVW